MRLSQILLRRRGIVQPWPEDVVRENLACFFCGARTTSGVVKRTSALGAGSFWRTWRPHSHHFFADSLFIGLLMC